MKTKSDNNHIFLIIIIFWGLSFSSCSKNSDSPKAEGYFMKFKIDGETVQFTETTAYTFDSPSQDPRYHYTINGGDGKAGFTINLSERLAIEENRIYNDTIIKKVPVAYMGYSPPDTTVYTHSSWIATINIQVALPCTVSISEVTDTNIKGTFSGEMLDIENNKSEEVTQGEFNVKRTILGITQ
ncbi:hypothetical protein K8352_02455 [Flavobacteriaceae bacterium F89]|uniref:Uncharacterized protein n=1 Tax=Cerina litoralis TaxID=2874477 RepID=A0AAE3EU24_9FLAO|nr:hypothetical protein [Cerina litoralis]MCG2459606.1 hypothetical protein [Cerina litoralis]